MKNIIKIKETQLRKLIIESVNKALSEDQYPYAYDIEEAYALNIEEGSKEVYRYGLLQIGEIEQLEFDAKFAKRKTRIEYFPLEEDYIRAIKNYELQGYKFTN